jgi:hypothetical protein
MQMNIILSTPSALSVIDLLFLQSDNYEELL